MKETLPIALKLMFGHEGGYVNVKTDAGGPTKYGITHKTLAAFRGKAAVSADEVKALTLKEAETIYRKNYWPQVFGDLLPRGLDYAAFDFGVNSGPATAVKQLQKVLGVKADGSVGEQTLNAIAEFPGGLPALIRTYCDRRMAFLRSLGGSQGWSANGRGWTIRVTGIDPKGKWKAQKGVLGNALELAGGEAPKADAAIPEVEAAGKAPPTNIGLPEIVKKPEVLGPLVGLPGAIGPLFTDNEPLKWAFAFLVVAGVLIGAYYIVRKIRRSE